VSFSVNFQEKDHLYAECQQLTVQSVNLRGKNDATKDHTDVEKDEGKAYKELLDNFRTVSHNFIQP
jgi:hypothetical protein